MAPHDNIGVTAYDVYRNGVQIASTGPQGNYSDLTVASEITYSYQIRARDMAGNFSALSGAASVTPPPGQTGLFTDDFERGNLSKWTNVTQLAAQQQEVFSGSWAARGTSAGSATWAYKQLSPTQMDLYYRIRFKVMNTASTVNLLKFRTSNGTSLLGAYVTAAGRLGYRNDWSATSTTSTTLVSTGVWHTLQLHVVVNGPSSQTETWFDDVKIAALSKTESLGTDPIGRIQLGENSTGRTYDIAFDTVVADSSFIVTDTTPPSPPTGLNASPMTPTRVDLSWSGSSDNISVAGYTIYRDGVALVGLPAGTLTYSDTSVSPGTTYAYTVDAFDGAGNHSAQSTPAPASTSSDIRHHLSLRTLPSLDWVIAR